MQISIEFFGVSVPTSGAEALRRLDLAIDPPMLLADLLALLDDRWELETSDKTVLLNGVYEAPTYALQDGDQVQILRMMQGG